MGEIGNKNLTLEERNDMVIFMFKYGNYETCKKFFREYGPSKDEPKDCMFLYHLTHNKDLNDDNVIEITNMLLDRGIYYTPFDNWHDEPYISRVKLLEHYTQMVNEKRIVLTDYFFNDNIDQNIDEHTSKLLEELRRSYYSNWLEKTNFTNLNYLSEEINGMVV